VWAAISKTDALVALGRVDDARAELEAFAPEPDDPTGLRVAIHRVRGHVEEAAREWAAATGHYGRARDIAEAGHEPDFLLAELEFDLARVTLPTDRNAAITLAQSALGRLPQSALLRPTIESWLDELYH
jgi:hypothetical protein